MFMDSLFFKKTFMKSREPMPGFYPDYGVAEQQAGESCFQYGFHRCVGRMMRPCMVFLNDDRTHYGEWGEGEMKQRIHGSTDLYGNETPSDRGRD